MRPETAGNNSVVFCGYLINRIELQKKYDLEPISDGALVAEIFDRVGIKVASELDGAYVAAVSNERDLFLFKDRVGLESLFAAQLHPERAFATSVWDLRSLMRFSICQEALPRYFAFGQINGPETLLSDVVEVQAGFVIRVDLASDEIEVTRYDKSLFNRFDPVQLSDEEIIQLCHEKFSAYFQYLRSSCAFGPIINSLSGGIDSSLTQAILQEQGINASFCANMKGYGSDASYARTMAEELGANLEVIEVDKARIGELTRRGIEIVGWPLIFEGEALFQEMYLRIGREHASASRPPVLLDGNGGDTLFGARITMMIMSMLTRLPRPALSALSRVLPTGNRLIRQLRILAGAVASQNFDATAFFSFWNSLHTLKNLTRMFRAEELGHIVDQEIAVIQEILGKGIPIEEALYRLELFCSGIQKTNAVDHLLAKHNGVRLLTPFMAADLQEFLMNVPIRRKQKRFTKKYLSKQLLSRYVPSEFIHRKKIYKDVPYTALFSEDKIFAGAIAELKESSIYSQYWKIDLDSVFSDSGDPVLAKKLINFQIWHQLLIE